MNNQANQSANVSFEWDRQNERLEIHGSTEGLHALANAIDTLASKGESDHIHLMTPEWGGSELSMEQQNSAASLIHHVKILLW